MANGAPVVTTVEVGAPDCVLVAIAVKMCEGESDTELLLLLIAVGEAVPAGDVETGVSVADTDAAGVSDCEFVVDDEPDKFGE